MLSTGAKAGIGVGVAVAVLLLLAIGFMVLRQRKRRRVFLGGLQEPQRAESTRPYVDGKAELPGHDDLKQPAVGELPDREPQELATDQAPREVAASTEPPPIPFATKPRFDGSTTSEGKATGV